MAVVTGTPLPDALRLSFPQLIALQKAGERREAVRVAAMANAVHAAAGGVMGGNGFRQFKAFVAAVEKHAHG